MEANENITKALKMILTIIKGSVILVLVEQVSASLFP